VIPLPRLGPPVRATPAAAGAHTMAHTLAHTHTGTWRTVSKRLRECRTSLGADAAATPGGGEAGVVAGWDRAPDPRESAGSEAVLAGAAGWLMSVKTRGAQGGQGARGENAFWRHRAAVASAPGPLHKHIPLQIVPFTKCLHTCVGPQVTPVTCDPVTSV